MILQVREEALLGLIRSNTDAIQYLNTSLAINTAAYVQLNDHYTTNVVLNKPLNNVLTQNVTLSTTFGLAGISVSSVPTFKFTKGSILQYENILPVSFSDPYSVVNFATLQAYVNATLGIGGSGSSSGGSGANLPSYAGNGGDFLQLSTETIPTLKWTSLVQIPQPQSANAGQYLSVNSSGGMQWINLNTQAAQPPIFGEKTGVYIVGTLTADGVGPQTLSGAVFPIGIATFNSPNPSAAMIYSTLASGSPIISATTSNNVLSGIPELVYGSGVCLYSMTVINGATNGCTLSTINPTTGVLTVSYPSNTYRELGAAPLCTILLTVYVTNPVNNLFDALRTRILVYGNITYTSPVFAPLP